MVKVSRASNKQGQLDPRYERLARHLRAQQEQRPKANKNRRRASRSAEKQVGYKKLRYSWAVGLEPVDGDGS